MARGPTFLMEDRLRPVYKLDMGFAVSIPERDRYVAKTSDAPEGGEERLVYYGWLMHRVALVLEFTITGGESRWNILLGAHATAFQARFWA